MRFWVASVAGAGIESVALIVGGACRRAKGRARALDASLGLLLRHAGPSEAAQNSPCPATLPNAVMELCTSTLK